MCLGCGACCYYCQNNAVTMVDFVEIGIRPTIKKQSCMSCGECLDVCPGRRYCLEKDDVGLSRIIDDEDIGPFLGIWEGYATDNKLRYSSSSGGILTAISNYCLKEAKVDGVYHTEMNPDQPWRNRTALSKTKAELYSRVGSRYSPSAPCKDLRRIDQSKCSYVFIGKPCDNVALRMLCKKNSRLTNNIHLMLSLFCAGTPSTRATLELIRNNEHNVNELDEVHYRGNGWPGSFRLNKKKGYDEPTMSYKDCWHALNSYRPFRCNLCPDGLGFSTDISCGDAWNRYQEGSKDPGRSLVIARNDLGFNTVMNAIEKGYLDLVETRPEAVIDAQKGLIRKKNELMGRLLAHSLMRIPYPKYKGFRLTKGWLKLSLIIKIKTIASTLRRIVRRGLWRRAPLIIKK